MTSKNRIGYACTPISIPYKTSRGFILKNFNEDIFKKCVSENIKDLLNILKWNVEHDIFLFRISSDIIPFGSHSVNNIEWWDIFKEELADCGQYIKDNEIRVSMHPGQYTVLNSPKESVVNKSISDLEYHCRFLDALNVDYSNKIILHVGGVYNDKVLAMKRFTQNFYRLTNSTQKRLVIENDDKSYTIEDVLSICKVIHVPAVFDNLHHMLNPCSLELNEIITQIKKTWNKDDGPIKLHYSDQDEIKKGGAHSKTVITSNFLDYLNYIQSLNADIMLEVKDKEISAIKCINSLKTDVDISTRMDQWEKYKYCVMEKSSSYYKKCSTLINSEVPIQHIYSNIDHCLNLPYDEDNFKKTIQHIYEYLNDKVTLKEYEKLRTAINNLTNNKIEDKSKVKDLLRMLCKKYGLDFLNNSYFFIY